jgi:hypothetical protein
MKTSSFLRLALLFCLFVAGCTDHNIPEPDQFHMEDFTGNLITPFALAKGANGVLWVTEVGTGHDDGQVSGITPDGKAHKFITGFKSVISPQEGLPDGLTHLTYKDGFLYIIQGHGGILYKVDVSKWKPGDVPIDAQTLTGQDIGSFVLAYNFKKDTGETHLYNLTWGPDGDLFFTDAAANAIIRRKWNGDLSVFAELAPVPNPAFPTLGPPVTDFVPTGIVFDGTKFLVSGLTGFPFNEGQSTLMAIDQAGMVSVHKPGFTLLVDVLLTPGNKPLVLQFAKFGAMGFEPNTGKVLSEAGTVILDGIMMPTDMERTDDHTYYLVSMALGKIIKLTF